MAARIPHGPAGIALQPAQRLEHTLERLGTGVAAHLQRQQRHKAGVGLPQF